MTDQVEMTREQAMKELIAYLEAKRADLEMQESPTSHIDAAIRQLKEDNAESAMDIILEDDLHFQKVECGDFDMYEGDESNTGWKIIATANRNSFLNWLIALECNTPSTVS